MRVVKIVSILKGTTYGEKLKELGLTTFGECWYRLDMIQTYKIVRKKGSA